MLNRSRLSWKDPSVTSSNQNNTRSLHVRSMKTKVDRGTPWEKSSRPRKNQTSTDNDERQSWTEKWELRMNGTGNSDFRARQVPVQHSAVRTRSLEHAGECYENNMRREETSQQVENPKNLSSALETRLRLSAQLALCLSLSSTDSCWVDVVDWKFMGNPDVELNRNYLSLAGTIWEENRIVVTSYN